MVEVEIPCIDLTEEGLDLEIKDEAWKGVSDKVREACETHGCFLVKYNGISKDLTEQLFKFLELIFDLPKETKNNCAAKSKSEGHIITYMGESSNNPQFETFGIHDALNPQVTQHFINLLLAADGNPNFCEVVHSMSSKMAKLGILLVRMMLESSNAGKYYEVFKENNVCVLAMFKHKVPVSEAVSGETLGPHTDKNLLSVLTENGVQGLEIFSKEGKWVQIPYPNNCFLVVVGDSLKAWSNGRYRAMKHRVVMKGERERYSCGLFLTPKGGFKIEAPPEFVDEDHPLLYRPFTREEYFKFYTENRVDEVLELFAGIPSSAGEIQ